MAVFLKKVFKVSQLQKYTLEFSSCPLKSHSGDVGVKSIKPFDSIPGPKSVPLVGTLWKYWPVIGEYRFDRLHVNGLRKFRQYGSLVREDIIPGVPLVWVYTPTDIETVYRCEGRYPQRLSHLALQKYRQDRPHIYNSGGLLPINGEEWWRLRSIFQRNLSRMQDMRLFVPITDVIVQEFIQYAVSSQQVADFLPKLSRLYLEITCAVIFGTRLNSFASAEQTTNSRSTKLINAAATTNSCILRTDNGLQLWRYFHTPLYRRLEQALQTVEMTAVELVNKVEKRDIETSQSLIAQYLSSSEVDIKDIYGMAVDLLLAGIDTTTYTSCFALYHLSTNLQAQELLYQEACQLLSNVEDAVTADNISIASMTRAVIKETTRINPISVGIGRILAKDAVLSGYHVPAKTVVVTQNQVTCQLKEYFPDPDQFIPERWIKGCKRYEAVSPYLVLPFGHGPRSCIARRLAEQNLKLLLLRVIREYKISWCGGNLGAKSLLINKPDQPVLLRFTKRSSV